MSMRYEVRKKTKQVLPQISAVSRPYRVYMKLISCCFTPRFLRICNKRVFLPPFSPSAIHASHSTLKSTYIYNGVNQVKKEGNIFWVYKLKTAEAQSGQNMSSCHKDISIWLHYIKNVIFQQLMMLLTTKIPGSLICCLLNIENTIS
jgi:hypothetical protein